MYRAKYLLVYSIHDPAGVNIAENLSYLEHFDKLAEERDRIAALLYNPDYNAYLASFKDDIIFIDYVDQYFDVEYYIYLSRHSSIKRIRSLTVHFTGNLSNEKLYGANPRELSKTYPPLAKAIITHINEIAKEKHLIKDYEIVYEATHHGPTNLNKPLVFVEIGSTIDEWKDKKVAEIIAEAVLKALADINSGKYMRCSGAIGVGGGHYSRKHTKYCLQSDICYSHIFSKHVLSMLSYDILEQALNKTMHPVKYAVIEKKGVKSSQRKIIESFAVNAGLSIKYI
ncbi:MAG: D-tyrosyl-tRNA(Tyr) deacylase [Thermoprotei archaeon]|nr:MAG: D-tyrosyl-tRNA(Tyr) deacylase [Thermoprotei archaeon]